MAEQKTQVDYVEVKAGDIIGERQAFYARFLTAAKFAIGATALILITIYLLWG